ncbi:MAG: AAA family ATPase [Aquificales bacterium]|nr:AAA family ATPase [Aquificales bacterium]
MPAKVRVTPAPRLMPTVSGQVKWLFSSKFEKGVSLKERSDLFLLQMAGTSGVGKSTLAQHVAQETTSVVIDYDVVKSAALEAGISWDMSGRVGYRASHAIAGSLLEQGISVILDSPCRFEFIVDSGVALATKHNGLYAFIECVLADENELRRRMQSRKRQRSQRVAFDEKPTDAPSDVMEDEAGKIIVPETKYPTSRWLQVDTSELVEQNVKQSLAYLKSLLANAK